MIMAVRKAEADEKQPYKMSFTSGGLFLNESVIVAGLHRSGEDWKDTLERALQENTTSLPKAASNRRTLREIVNRLMMLNDDEVCFLIEEAGRQEQQYLLWVATCRAYRFVREYAVEVICDRFLAYQLDLPLESFDIFFEAKADWDDRLKLISDSTRHKLRQILFRMMREAGVLSDDHRIQSSYLSPKLRQLLETTHPADLAVFPGVVIEGGLP